MSDTNGSHTQAPKLTDDQKFMFVHNAISGMIQNAYSMRAEWARALNPDRRRNIEDECGHPSNAELDGQELFHDMFERDPVANRVVEVLSKETWQVQPEIYENEKTTNSTRFERALRTLGKQLGGPDSWHQDGEGSLLWENLTRADILSGIGRYGVIVLGINDGRSLDQPAARNVMPEPVYQLEYMRCFPEIYCQIKSYEQGLGRRYGQPEVYSIDFSHPTPSGGGGSLKQESVDVHWTRVIHLADNTTTSTVYGTERCRPVMNRLLDLKKLYGGSAEMYYKGAFPGVVLKTQPQLGGEPMMSQTDLKTMIELYQNGLQRYLAVLGFDVESLTPQVVDPTPQIMTQLQAICVKLGIPMRIFMGSERGDLASSQDDESWNERLKGRQNNYVTPKIICPLVDRLIYLGVLPEPKGYTVHWPDLSSQTVQEKSGSALQLAQAIAQYVNSGSAKLMTPLDFFISVLGWDAEQSKMMADKIKDEDLVKLRNPPDKQPKPLQVPGKAGSKTAPAVKGTDKATK